MELVVNGHKRQLGQASLEALVLELAGSPRGVAVAVNGELVPRSSWASHQLADGDRVEVLNAAAGG